MSHENSMRTLLQASVTKLSNSLKNGLTFEEWYLDYAMDFDHLAIGDSDHRESMSYERGYLQGAADAIGVTIIELLESEGVNIRKTKRRDSKVRRVSP